MKKVVLVLAAGILALMAVPALAHDEGEQNLEAAGRGRGEIRSELRDENGLHLGVRGRGEARGEVRSQGRGNSEFGRGRGEARGQGEGRENAPRGLALGHRKQKQIKKHMVGGVISKVDATAKVVYLQGREEGEEKGIKVTDATVFLSMNADGAKVATFADFAAGDHVHVFLKKPAEGETMPTAMIMIELPKPQEQPAAAEPAPQPAATQPAPTAAPATQPASN